MTQSLHQKALDFASSIVGEHFHCILETTRSALKFYLKKFSKALPIDIDIKFFAYKLIKPRSTSLNEGIDVGIFVSKLKVCKSMV